MLVREIAIHPVLGMAPMGDANLLSCMGRVKEGAHAILDYAERFPIESGLAGLDFPVYELRMGMKILEGAHSLGKVSRMNLAGLSRLEAVVVMARARLENYIASQEAQERSSTMGDFSAVATLGAALLGLVGAVA